MHRYGAVTSSQLLAIQDQVRTRLQATDNFEDSAQAFASIVREHFKESSPLVRLFITSRYDGLPENIRELARTAAAQTELGPSTIVLTLFGTSGARPEWESRRTSATHKVIPLASRAFVDGIPMVASLLAELDLPIEAGDAEALSGRVLAGGWYGIFFVKDARSTLDSSGRHIIPSQAFVSEEGIRSVWGIGVAYPNGAVATLLGFTREDLDRSSIEALVPLMRTFKVASSGLVTAGRMFRPDEPGVKLDPASR